MAWDFLLHKWKPIVFFIVPIFAILAFLWISQKYVMANLSTKTVHVYPTAVTSEGWQQSDRARVRDLAANSTLASFTSENSAYVVRGSGVLNEVVPESTPAADVAPERIVPTDSQEETEAQKASEPEVPSEAEAAPQEEPAADDAASEAESPADDGAAPAADESVPASIESSAETPSEALPEEPTEAQPDATPETQTESIAPHVRPFASLPRALEAFAAATFAPVALASVSTTTEVASTTAASADVSTCTVLESECYVLEGSGFAVEGALLDTRFESATLHFSFASALFENGEDDRLTIRYFHDGTWRHAGELYLNKEFSNAVNGGYFTHVLEDVDGWDDLSSMKVVVEYEANGEHTEVYLDSLWLEIDYKERAAHILDGEVLGVSGENVEEVDTAAGSSSLQTLVLDDGSRITFPYADDRDELMMRSDKLSYRTYIDPDRPYESAVYVSVTNTTSKKDSFRLVAALPGEGSIREVTEYMRNVPYATSTSLVEDVSYLCEAGWRLGTSTNQYVCDETHEVRSCSWVNDSKENCLVSNEIVGVENSTAYRSAWVNRLLVEVPNNLDLSDDMPEGYIAIAATDELIEILPGQTIYFRILFDITEAPVARFALYAVGGEFGELVSDALQEEQALSQTSETSPQRQKRINERISTRTNFEGDELPEFKFRFKTQRGFITRAINRALGRDNGFTIESARIQHMQGQEEVVPVDITYEADGAWTLSLKDTPRTFKPGKYTVHLTIREGFSTYEESVDFYWGVLAVNTNKSIYEPGERAEIHMAALDDTGSTICNARLELVVTDPSNNSQRVTVEASDQCGPNNVIDVPDYAGVYYVGNPGTYEVALTELDRDGAVIHHIDDSFEVREDVAFDVERKGPTRIYPKAPYTMEISVRAKTDFTGTITEALPLGFEVLEKDGGMLEQYGEALRLSWHVALKAGDLYRVRYTFDAPDISPYLYVLGPLTIESDQADSEVFEETRSWKIASDALGSYVEKASSWSPASTGAWIVKDLSGTPFNVPADAVLEIAIVNSDVANERVGGVRHASSSLTRSLELQEAEPQGTTEVVMHVQASATSSIQTYAESAEISYVLLGYWTSGYYVETMNQIDPGVADNTWGNTNLVSFGVASGTIAEMVIGNWNESAERNGGVRRTGSSLSRLADLHESEGAGGGTQGISAATMMVKAQGANSTIQVFSEVEGANGANIDFWLIGYWSQNPTGLDYTERFDNLTGPTSGSTWTDRALDSFGPGANSIAEVLFADSADANNSQLLGVRTNGSSLDRSRNIHEAEAGGWSVGRSHVLADNTASATIEYFTDDTANDLWRLLGYWSATNTPPTAPTLYDIPFESEKTGSSTPYFRFLATDPDGTSDIIYQIQWDDDAVLDDAPLGDRTSDVETGCSPNCFTNTVSGGDTSPFTEGNQIQFAIQSSLVSGTTYYWRVRAKDATGSTLYGDWSDVKSFTYIANTDPKQWFQTEAAQFEMGTLSSVVTTAEHTAELTESAPTETLLTYAEGTVQTPRYRTWNGSAWSAEGSASSVGGTIQWIVTKAGTTRNEYILGTQDSGNDVNVQVFNGTTSTWGNLQEVIGGGGGVSDNTMRGFDIAYESNSGDAIVAYCDGDADPSYYVWNGTSWVSGGTINLSSGTACEVIKMASDPVSDEIILVSRNTGTQYEAQVWNGSSWSNSNVLGSMSDLLHEGIAVEYEESGNQAVVVVSNGASGNFAWTSWDGASWSINTTQGLGDDFEWGVLKQDQGSDNMALCYVDQDDDIGIVRWDGAGWQTNQEIDTGANVGSSGLADGRPVTCEFETTSGRDGYLMVPYSDTTNGRYQVWNGSSFSGESSVSTIQDSWTVESVRTGDGLILAMFFDDTNGRYDFSYWDGTGWATLQTLENSPSVTAEPYRQPLAMAARLYQPSSGSVLSDAVDFDWVPGQPTWGEVLWNTIEPGGTDVKMQVYYGSSCASLVPDVALPGNSTGYDVSASPLDISSLSTSTYNQLCLKTTLTSTNQNEPALEDWTISWERQPYLTQTSFRWYVNANSATVSDPWPSGSTDLNENESIPQIYGPSPGNVMRLRLAILDENVALSSSALSLTLQYAEGTTCSASMTWLDVGAIGSTTAAWRGYNNSSPSDGATLPSRVLSTTDSSETYEEENGSTLNPSSISANDEGEWDWAIEHNATAGVNYCFRVVTSNGEALNEYDSYPSILTNKKPNAPTLSTPFDNERTASTSPWFEFSAEDTEGNDITYQIQISTDNTFASTAIDTDSQNNLTDFTNLITPSDKDPYNSGQLVRYTPPSALSNATTYYWRVRGKDRNASNTWSDWSSTYSVTINTSNTISTWFQTELEQFETNSFDDTEATSTDQVILTPPFTSGTTTSSDIDFDWHTTGNAWGELSWTDTETSSTILYHLEYLSGSTWSLIPDSALPGNAAGFGTSPVSLLGVDPTTYNQIRIRANFTDSGATPRLSDWTLEWGYAVEQPTLVALFDNEKTGTTTPTFEFLSQDPEDDDLMYEISWSTTPDFTSSTTRRSSTPAGWTNISSTTDSSPFFSGDTIQYKIQSGDALTNGTTYWWRVRAIDTTGGNVWSVWSPLRSFTVDTSVTVSTWFQTTDEQFDTNELDSTETSGSDSVQIASTIREALVAYAEGVVQAPRFRIWNGTTWGTEATGVSVGDTIRFVESAAAPTRDEYIIASQGSTGRVDVQVVDGTIDTAGNKVQGGVASNILRRGFDVAYETDSGDALQVTCAGTEAVYRVWDGASWSATSTITLSITNSCEWVRLASDPQSDEIIAVFRDTTAGATDYQALVWNGSSWGNSATFGSQTTAANEGMAVAYEESGGQAIVVVADGANNNFQWNAWNGSGWSGAATVSVGNDFANGRIAVDEGSDELALCYIDIDGDIGVVDWDGSGWGSFSELELTGNSANGRPLTCEFETTAGRDNYLMVPYSDDILAAYQYWDNSIYSGEAALTTISDSWELRSARTGDGNMLVVAYDDANTEYDFTYWNGTSWSAEEVLETTSITTFTPATIPIDIVARRYPQVVSGSVTSDEIDFDDGSGLKWDEVTWTDTTPGSSEIAVQVQYYNGTAWELVPDALIPGNSLGATTSPIDLGALSYTTYNELRLVANFTCIAGNCPVLSDWAVTWAPGLVVSGTAKQFDGTTNVTSGTVAVAVNGTLQSGRTGSISGGTWSIDNVPVFTGDVVTVWIEGANDANEAVAVTSYDGVGDILGMELYERYVTLGSSDNPTLTNDNLSQYDNSVSGDEDIFHEVDAGNDLSTCLSAGCESKLFVKAGTTYRPDSASSGNVTTHDVRIDGYFTADGNTITLTGSWDNNGTFTSATSTVVMSATSTFESIDSTGATTSTFYNLTFGSATGTATYSASSTLDINGNLTLSHNTFSPNAQQISLAGNLVIGYSSTYTKGSGTLTFDGANAATWYDGTTLKQDIGSTTIDGTAKVVSLASAAKAMHVTIGSDDTLSAGSSYALEVVGNWTNNNNFTAQSGTVTFAATSTGRTITQGNSSFYNLTFNGVGGNWAFNGANLTISNDLTIATGTLTLPTGTTTIAGSFDASTGSFMHNNGTLYYTSSASESVTPGTSSMYDTTFGGSGSWSFGQASATSSRHVIQSAGTLTAPSGVYAIGGSLYKTGGVFTHNSGTLKFTGSGAEFVRLNASDAHTLSFTGSGTWSFVDTNATTTGSVLISGGTVTLPTGVLAIGGSFSNAAAFSHASGTVRFNSSDTGESIDPGLSWFNNVLFASPTGGWTITQNATTTGTTTLASAGSFTLASGRTLEAQEGFINQVGGASTTWAGSVLYLNSNTRYAVNAKTSGGDEYGTLLLGTSTKVSLWNSSSTAVTVDASASVYSQDHAGVDGDLSIWGAYTNTGNEYWSYATDFDGTALGGSSRQVDVRLAPNTSVTFSSGTLQILGTTTATTTIANQGSGTYGLTITGGTVNAQYYQVRNTNSAGVAISGTPTITSLSDGDYELSVPSGGTTITLADTAIDANPALEIQRVQFGVAGGVSDGYNVVATGGPSSYWWFRNHYGSYDGEDYDNDPGGNPGNVRWDDSGFTITVAGTVYSDDGQTTMGAPTCDGTTPVVRVVVSGGSAYTGSCDSGTGAYSIPNVSFSGDAVITAYLNSGGGARASTVTRTPSGNITDLDLYQNTVIARREGVDALTIANMAVYDSGDDADVLFTAATGSPDTLTTAAGTELHIWTGSAFTPGGNVTVQGGSGESEGRLHVATSSVFTATGAESHVIGGSLHIDQDATFAAGNSTVTFNATSQKTIRSTPLLTLYAVDFNGAGGTWSLISAGTTTVQNTFTVTSGTLAGTGSIRVQSGSMTGNGSVQMTSGTVQLEGAGSFGGNSAWQFHNLTLGSGSVGTSTKAGSGTTTVRSILRVVSSQVFEAQSAPLTFTGGGTPFAVAGTFDVGSAPVYYTGTSTVNVADETYANLTLAPSAAGSPTYHLMGGTLEADDLTIGDGTNALTSTADTNDPSVVVNDDLVIAANATHVASNLGVFQVGGSWSNAGTFTANGATVTFNSTDTGETITPGSSPFYNLTFNDSGGGWTISANATSTNNTTLTAASSFTLSPGSTLSVGGTFTNAVGNATTWTGSTLRLVSGTSYSINAKTDPGDIYGDLDLGNGTHAALWYSSSTAVTTAASSSVYSQDHAGVNGDLYIWGVYTQSGGSNYWSYATDFDGTSLTGSERQVDVRIASSSTITLSGGVLDILGDASATTTLAVNGTGRYTLNVTGGTLNANYYSLRNLTANGLTMSGTPTITSLSYGDYELDLDGGTLMTVAGSVIDANVLKIFTYNRFATSTGVATGTAVTATGSTGSSWKFNLHYGAIAGEAFDIDPQGDPGYLRWDDSATDVTISGNVYSDEGSTVSAVCNGSTQVVRLRVQGAGSYTSACSGVDGSYSIPDVSYNPGDTFTVYLDTNGGAQAANVTVDVNTNIANMHLYENRVIVRHEDTTPITIADMALYDVDNDSDIPFTATDAGTDTLVLPPEKKLIVWNAKTFAPAGNVTISSGGSGAAHDGSLELYANAIFSAALTQSHAIGGSFIVGSDASLSAASSTFTFTATTTGKTITPNGSSFYNLVFNGSGGNWAFSGGFATTSNDFTITTGTVTMPSGTTTIGGSFQNSGTFMHNNGVMSFTSSASGKTIQASGSNFYGISLNGAGAWTFSDTNATTSNNFIVAQGSTTAPTGVLAVGNSFENAGTFNHSGTLRLYASAAGKTLRTGASPLRHLLVQGSGGAWSWSDTSATTTGNLSISAGTLTLPSNTLSIGGSFANTGSFNHASGTVRFNSSDTGETINPGNSSFYGLTFASASGGWTLSGNATSTASTTISAASSFTVSPGVRLAVGAAFTNAVGGAATTWTNATLYLFASSTYAVNSKSNNGDSYGNVHVASSTHISLWKSSFAYATTSNASSIYSQDHGDVDGDLYIWGTYTHTSGSAYWSYATDFDGTALGGSSRQVDVRIASSSTVTYEGGALNIIGTAAATTTIATMDTGRYTLAITGGTLNASYYSLRNLSSAGLSLSGTPTITSLSNGDFELDLTGGSMITVSNSVIDANASKVISNVSFATSSGVASGYNVTLSGTPVGAWNFDSHSGNYDGESFDNDGGDSCGYIRWDDSSCLFVNQAHYRWRTDLGGEAAPTSDWYNASWSKRKRVTISNNTPTAYTNLPTKLTVSFDSDMQADFDDLRFTDSSGTTSLDYWIEDYSSGVSATVWVEVPSLAGSSTAVVYLYYGNSGVLTSGDGEAVFRFFDDFEDADVTEYSGNTSMFEAAASFNYTGTYGLSASTGNEDQQTTTGIYRTGTLTQRGDTIRFFQYLNDSGEDEPCVFFGVQGVDDNYAVCLDQYPAERLVIAEDVTSNDGSGSYLASTTVNFATGWYEVVVDWHTNGLIDVTVYDDLGSEFATLQASDSDLSSGGVGFGYWAQNGGWDYYSVKQYTATAPSYSYGLEQGTDGASWMAAEDTAISGIDPGDNIRVRFSVENTGAPLTGQEYRLQVANKSAAASCEAVPFDNYSDVPTTSGGCGSAAACIVSSTQFTNQASTTQLLSSLGSLTFTEGKMVEDPSNQTDALNVGANQVTEVEYALELTNNATSSAYCFRTTDGGTSLDNYDRVAELSLEFAPYISNFALNDAVDITLTEGATTTVYATGTVTDLNGYTDIVSATSTIYRSAVGPECAVNDNDCYQIPAASCSLSDCAGNSCTLMCRADLQYIADPTDAGIYSGQQWLARVQVEDTDGLDDVETSFGIDLLSLYGLTVTSNIDFGSLEVGQDTGSYNATTTINNTGNTNIDIQLEGTDLAGSDDTIPVGEQKYATTTFVYSSCVICSFLTGTATNVEVDLAKPTSTTSPISEDVYWGINVPSGTAAEYFEGVNTFWATSD